MVRITLQDQRYLVKIQLDVSVITVTQVVSNLVHDLIKFYVQG